MPVAPLICAEEVVVTLVVYDHRIGSGAMSSPLTEVWDGCIAVVDVNWVAIGGLFLLCQKTF